MNRFGRVMLVLGCAGAALACGASEPSAQGMTPGPGTGAAGATMQPAGPAALPGQASAPPSTMNPSSTTPSTPAAPGDPAMMPPAQPSDPAAAGGEARFPDACQERRNSWSKPCSDNPDPCGLNSGYLGDEYCLLPPPEGQGVQIHFGPKDYKDAAEVEKYTIEPGEEFNSYGIVNVPTTEDHWYSYVKLSMRPGSHHVINNLIAGHPAEGFVSGGSCDGQSAGGFVGTQVLILESPPQGIPAPENEGLGRMLPGNSSICQNYHRYNFTDKPMLSEIWYNVWFTDEAKVTQKASGVTVFAGPNQGIAPGTQVVLTKETTVSGPGRIISLFGHRHAATERFGVWLNDALVYDSWDWVESRVFNYDSITDNPPPNPDAMTDGAASGIMEVKKGDTIRVECHVNNQTDKTLRFSNELFDGEMCILFGSAVGVSIN